MTNLNERAEEVKQSVLKFVRKYDGGVLELKIIAHQGGVRDVQKKIYPKGYLPLSE